MSLSFLASDVRQAIKEEKVVDILSRFRHKTSTARREAKGMRREEK
jgi:hypothetical protein